MGNVDCEAVLAARKAGATWKTLRERFGIAEHSLRLLLTNAGLVNRHANVSADETEGELFFSRAADACDDHLDDLRKYHPELERKAA